MTRNEYVCFLYIYVHFSCSEGFIHLFTYSNNLKFVGYGIDLYKYLIKHEKRILKALAQKRTDS